MPIKKSYQLFATEIREPKTTATASSLVPDRTFLTEGVGPGT